MQILKPLLVAAAALAAMQAHAVTVGMNLAYVKPIPMGLYAAPSFTNGTKANVETGSVLNVYMQPLGTTGGYLSVSSQGGSAGSATINTFGASSYSFVWGSPDTFNTLDVFGTSGVDYTYTGTTLASMYGFTANGDNNNTGFITLTGTGGEAIDHLVLKSSGVAFEVAVAAVPEPETYALMLAGLGALGFIARRRRG